MKMSKDRAEELLQKVLERIRDTKVNAQVYRDELEILTSAKAYLEFITSGLKQNPSLKKKAKENE